jgi:hypothetical protein
MSSSINAKTTEAWNFIWDKLFLKNTNLFYDYITSHDTQERFKHLPSVEEIEFQTPNPCGWGTGMEDSMLNGGVAMDVICLRYEQTGDEACRELAEKVFKGMCLCAEVHGRPGFVTRSVSPRDKKSCYSNSSRDQFTLFVYGVWRFWRSPLSDKKSKEKARDLLIATAEYCKKTIIPENDYNLLRLDGKKAMVSKMQDCDTHEIMRLPMFYAAAWDASGDEHWRDMYLKHAEPGIELNVQIDRKRGWWDIALSQMQFSLRLLYEVETRDDLRGKYAEALNIGAELAEVELAKKKTEWENFPGNLSCLNTPWRKLHFKLRDECNTGLLDTSLWCGYPYMMPNFPYEYHNAAALLRSYGNLATSIFLPPERKANESAIKIFIEFFQAPDYKRCGSAGVINLLEGIYLYRNKQA